MRVCLDHKHTTFYVMILMSQCNGSFERICAMRVAFSLSTRACLVSILNSGFPWAFTLEAGETALGALQFSVACL